MQTWTLEVGIADLCAEPALGGRNTQATGDVVDIRRRFDIVDLVENRLPTVEEYLALRRSVGWRVPTADEARSALENSAFGVVTVSDEGIVGSGRVVGDGAFFNFVVDLIVAPEHQRSGIGRRLLLALEDATQHRSATGVLQLVADGEVAPFYERCGYEPSQSRVFLKRLPLEGLRNPP